LTLLIDQIAERTIQSAIKKGTLDNLPGKGNPIVFEDETFIPCELRMAYRMLKNAGYIPPELEQRNHIMKLCELINKVETDREITQQAIAKLKKIELKMQIKGIDTRFIYHYLSLK